MRVDGKERTYVEEIDFFEQFLLVVFELPDHCLQRRDLWRCRIRGRACELGSVFQPISGGRALPSSSSSPAFALSFSSPFRLFASASFTAFVASPQTVNTRVRTPPLPVTDTHLARLAIHIVIP